MKTLGIYYATACYKDSYGRYYTSGGLGRYLQAIVKYPLEVVLLAPTTKASLSHLRHPLPDRQVTVYELPYFETFRQAVSVRSSLLKRIRQFPQRHHVDVMWLRYPGAYGTEVWLHMKKHGVPLFVELVGDPAEVIQYSTSINLLQRYVGLLIARQHEADVRRLLRQVPAFAVSRPLAVRFAPPGICVPVIACSTTTESDFHQRTDTCQQEPIKVLYVGGLNHQKSVDTLIHAVSILQRRGLSLDLHLVGSGPLQSFLEKVAQAMLERGSYHFHGFVVDSAKLHQHYVSADLFVMSSIHEGFPRVLPEAMARSLPVVATAVGGIPEIVRDEETGLLVPPRHPAALAQAMERIVRDGELRRKLIANSFAVAREYTVDAFLKKVFSFVSESTKVNLAEECVSSSSSQVL